MAIISCLSDPAISNSPACVKSIERISIVDVWAMVREDGEEDDDSISIGETRSIGTVSTRSKRKRRIAVAESSSDEEETQPPTRKVYASMAEEDRRMREDLKKRKEQRAEKKASLENKKTSVDMDTKPASPKTTVFKKRGLISGAAVQRGTLGIVDLTDSHNDLAAESVSKRITRSTTMPNGIKVVETVPPETEPSSVGETVPPLGLDTNIKTPTLSLPPPPPPKPNIEPPASAISEPSLRPGLGTTDSEVAGTEVKSLQATQNQPGHIEGILNRLYENTAQGLKNGEEIEKIKEDIANMKRILCELLVERKK